MAQGPLAELAGGLVGAVLLQPRQADLAVGIERQLALRSALAAAFPRAARCSLEVIVGRKVIVATACSGSVRQPLIQIRGRGSAQDAQPHSLQPGNASDTLRSAVPLSRPGKWRPFRRRSADWLSDSSSTSAVLYLQLAAPHVSFTPQDQCVLEGLAALLGMQLVPTLPMLKRGSRRGGGQGVEAAEGSTPADSESRTDRVRRRSSEFVISMKRTSGTFLRLIHLGNDGATPRSSGLWSRNNSATEPKRRHSNTTAPLRTFLSDQPIPEDQPATLARPCSAPLTAPMQHPLNPGLLQQYRASRHSWQQPSVVSGGGLAAKLQGCSVLHAPPVTSPNPFAAAANPFATAPPRAGGQPWGGPVAPCSGPQPAPQPQQGEHPHVGAYAPVAAMAPPTSGGPAPAPTQLPSTGGPTNPFAAISDCACDWGIMGEPQTYEGDGFDSDTTDFVSRNVSCAPFARTGGGLRLFATDDQVWLPGGMVWDGQRLRPRSPLPLPAHCGLTAAAAGTIRREGLLQPQSPFESCLDAFANERRARVDRWAEEHAVAHSPEQLAPLERGPAQPPRQEPPPAEADTILLERRLRDQLEHRRLSLERRVSAERHRSSLDAERERERSSLEAPVTPPVAQSPRAAPTPRPACDRLQRAMDRVEARTSGRCSSPARATCHRSSIPKPSEHAATPVPATHAAEAPLVAASAAAQRRPLQRLQTGLEAFLLAAIVGWLLYRVTQDGV